MRPARARLFSGPKRKVACLGGIWERWGKSTLAAVYPHIETLHGEPARLSGHPRTRVAMLAADYLWRGWSAEEIVRHYPYLTLAEVHAALVYYLTIARRLTRSFSRRATSLIPGARPSHGFRVGAFDGEMIADLELIAKATEPAFWRNRVEQLPL